MVKARGVGRMLAASGAVWTFGLFVLSAVPPSVDEERALMDFFKRRRPAKLGLRPKFPYPYDYIYASLLSKFPEAGKAGKPEDSKNFSPLEAAPGSPEEALRDIVAAWRDAKPELIRRHLDPRTPVACYVKGVFSHLLSPEEFLSFTELALPRLRTLAFRFQKLVRASEEEASATGVHIFLDPEGRKQSVAVEVTLVKVGDMWVIRGINYGPAGESERKGKCLVSSLLFGPNSEEVATLLAFRDKCLLRSRIGRLAVRIYYRIAGPLSYLLAGMGPTFEGLARLSLKPVLSFARWAVRASHSLPAPGPGLGGV